MIDDQPETFTADIVRQLKENHETWVNSSLDKAVSTIASLSANPLEQAFKKVESAMPDLVSEMRSDLSTEGSELIREFFLVSKRWVMNYGPTPRFVYYYEDHDNLDGKVQVLEGHGFVVDVTTGKAKLYRMMEGFAELLLDSQ